MDFDHDIVDTLSLCCFVMLKHVFGALKISMAICTNFFLDSNTFCLKLLTW